ncbi:MAG: hypothetical protein J5494_06055 [Candidatus Methanomethylophilaceae archaeon]|nr:hypothetical protein [Candidatus Methanomethylophilaceae archaeon]
MLATLNEDYAEGRYESGMEDGFDLGLEQGRKEALRCRVNDYTETVLSLMEGFGLSLEKVLESVKIPEDIRGEVLSSVASRLNRSE